MRLTRLALIGLTAMLCYATPLIADESSGLQENINLKYRNFFGPDSQSLLPLRNMEMPGWKQLQSKQALKRIYVEPGKYYNAKVYTFTLYQDAGDGSYYLDAKGGFWGMDELVYGPLSEQELLSP